MTRQLHVLFDRHPTGRSKTMPKTQSKPIDGTVRVGRWEYPARKYTDGTVERNTKKDGSGETEPVTGKVAGSFTATDAATATVTSLASKKATKTATKTAKKATAKTPGQARATVTWAAGSKCANGHVLTAEDIYTMPNGRKQCRRCRRAYASNQSKKAATA